MASVIKDSMSPDRIRLTTVGFKCPAHLLLELLPIRELSITRTTPHMYDHCIATSSQWKTVFTQIRGLQHAALNTWADEVEKALLTSKPEPRKADEWHLPFVDQEDVDAAVLHVLWDHKFQPIDEELATTLGVNLLARVSASRCGRAVIPKGDRTHQIDLDLAVLDAAPIDSGGRRDWYDHQACPDLIQGGQWLNTNLHGNLTGWCQYRQIALWEQWKNRQT